MKTLNESFTDKEFAEMKRAKHKLKNGVNISWRNFLLKIARQINKYYEMD